MPAEANAFLRTVLTVDAAASAVSGLAMAGAAGTLGPILGLPPTLLLVLGLVCVVYAAAVAWVARSPVITPRAVWILIALNVLWGIECIALPVLGLLSPTALGWAFLMVQAAFVFVIADLQWLGLRRSVGTRAAAA